MFGWMATRKKAVFVAAFLMALGGLECLSPGLLKGIVVALCDGMRWTTSGPFIAPNYWMALLLLGISLVFTFALFHSPDRKPEPKPGDKKSD